MKMRLTAIFIFLQVAFFVNAQIVVWPGDANNDGIVNNIDVLFIGKTFSQQGNTRDSLSFNWKEFEVLPWNITLPNGLNAAYTDCSGNGFVNIEDVNAVALNYDETNVNFNGISYLQPIAGSPTLTIIQNEIVWEASDTVSITIFLNQEELDSIYSVAFQLNYDTTLIKEAFIELLPNPQFGGGGRQPIYVQKNKPANGFLEFGISRTNNFNHGGSIAVANASMIIEDNLIGKTFLDITNAFSVSNIKMYNKALDEIAVHGDTIDAKITTTISEKKLAQQFSVFPIPAKDKIWIQSKNNVVIEQIQLLDLKGVTQNISPEIITNTATININQLPKGMYILKVITPAGVFYQKIQAE